jgi:hypothetical protein
VVAGTQIRSEDASQLSKMFKGRPITDDWDEIPNLPRPFDVLGRQIQNLGWGSRIRRRYANVVLTIVAVLLGIDTFRQQRAIARERDRVCAFAEDETLKAARHVKDAAAQNALLVLSRQVQDTL